jgi:hypothetical protein
MEHIPMEPLAFLYAVMRLLKVIEDILSIDRSLLLFVHDDACAESNRSCMERRSGAPYFLYAVLRV